MLLRRQNDAMMAVDDGWRMAVHAHHPFSRLERCNQVKKKRCVWRVSGKKKRWVRCLRNSPSGRVDRQLNEWGGMLSLFSMISNGDEGRERVGKMKEKKQTCDLRQRLKVVCGVRKQRLSKGCAQSVELWATKNSLSLFSLIGQILRN